VDVAVVRKRGLSSTIQDGGRTAGMGTGMPPGGAADLLAYRLNNIVLGNPDGAAALELVLYGGKLEFLIATEIAVTGADMAARVNGTAIPMATPIEVSRGSLLETTMARRGCFAYLGIAGGLDGAVVLGSRSTYADGDLGGSRRPLQKGDTIMAAADAPDVRGPRFSAEDVNDALCEPPSELRVLRGPQAEYFGYTVFTLQQYTVSNRSNRMAYRLEGPAPEVNAIPRTADTGDGLTDCIEEGIPPGGIEVAGGKELICFAREGPTSGAYAKIATIISTDVSHMAQLRPGDTMRFREVDINEALAARAADEAVLAAARSGA
jgi:antagonist of KipI